MNKTLLKTALREIRHSFGRFVSITCIIALGVGFYSGLNVMLEDMTDTADNYYHQHCFYDYKLMNTLGFDDESVASAKADRNVLSAEGAFSCDAVFKNGDNESVLKVCSQGKSINTLSLKAGRLAENENECVADAGYNGEDAIGKTLVIADTNDKDTLDSFSVRQFKIVGIADSPVYLNYERGTSKLGNGTVSAFIYTVDKAFTSEYYTEIYLKLNNQSRIYSDEYDDYIAKTKPQTKERISQKTNPVSKFQRQKSPNGQAKTSPERAKLSAIIRQKRQDTASFSLKGVLLSLQGAVLFPQSSPTVFLAKLTLFKQNGKTAPGALIRL